MLSCFDCVKDFFIMEYVMLFHVMMNYFTYEVCYGVICYD